MICPYNFFSFLGGEGGGGNIRMIVITVEAYQNARVHTITVKNKDFFWVKMRDVQDRLGIKNVSDLLRK